MNQLLPTAEIAPDLNQQDIDNIKQRFFAISEERLARTRFGLNDRQQIVLDTLPALFHYNHPALPGYVSQKTPSGLSGFNISNRNKLAIKRLASNFEFPQSNAENAIYSIFIMGSVGSIAHGNRSDLDVWICHNPDLDSESKRLLEHKCERISRWAEAFEAEVHCFVMNSEEFRQGKIAQLDDESSGSSQHYLLLDEFYRSGIWLGGRIPLWWLVPPHCENQYEHFAKSLLDSKLVATDEVIDFGSVAKMPINEFVGAGIWQLYKGIDSPYKSVLKLLLLETYASTYPNIKSLSVEFKERVYGDEFDLNQIDAYLCLYRRIELYLKGRKERKRLELVRRSFYFLVDCPLTQQSSPLGWQWRLLQEIVHEWGWQHRQLTRLDARATWKAAQTTLEKQNLVQELTRSYRFVSDFGARQSDENAIDQSELRTLGRKLNAAFDRRAGKIEFINPDISLDIKERVLLFKKTELNQSSGFWQVYGLPKKESNPTINLLLKQSHSLSELLCWCYLNGIYDLDTDIIVRDDTVSESYVKQFLSSIGACIVTPPVKPKHDEFLRTPHIKQVLVFTNLAGHVDVKDSKSNADPNDTRDAFSYGSQQKNLVSSIELIVINSWNEVVCQSFSENCVQQIAVRYLQLFYSQPTQEFPEIIVFSPRSPHSNCVSERMRELFRDLNSELTRQTHSPTESGLRYVFKVAKKYHLLRSFPNKPHVDQFDSQEALLAALQRPQSRSSILALDRYALNHHPLKLVIDNAQQRGIKVFVLPLALHRARVFIVDCNQSLIQLQFPFGHLDNLLHSLKQFIQNVLHKQPILNSDDPKADECPILFYRLKQEHGQWLDCETIELSKRASMFSDFEVKVIVEPINSKKLHYRLFCDQFEFSGDLPQQIAAVKQFILSHRKGDKNYPCYLSDIDISLCREQINNGGELFLSHYLRIKNDIEQKLNSTLLR